ncbi:MAG: DNA-directed RNA polymerase subunit omega, partial [Enterococcus sp.]|nr:DNA-directed RNA polymerase subunit omega [Enterococcus sp.]
MLYPSISTLRKKVDSKYTLAMLVSKRAKHITEGKHILTAKENSKPVTTAAWEIEEDLIT